MATNTKKKSTKKTSMIPEVRVKPKKETIKIHITESNPIEAIKEKYEVLNTVKWYGKEYAVVKNPAV